MSTPQKLDKPITLYKLTDQNMQTHGGFQWALGRPREASGSGGLCGPGWLHAYSDPALAVALNPIHADYSNPRLFVAEGHGMLLDDRGLKCGVTQLTLVARQSPPKISTAAKVHFAILCGKMVYTRTDWLAWADAWLDRADRTAVAAYAAYAANPASAAYAAAALPLAALLAQAIRAEQEG